MAQFGDAKETILLSDDEEEDESMTLQGLRELFDKCLMLTESGMTSTARGGAQGGAQGSGVGGRQRQVAVADITTLCSYLRWSAAAPNMADKVAALRPTGTLHGQVS
jgi:hypothetical protein